MFHKLLLFLILTTHLSWICMFFFKMTFITYVVVVLIGTIVHKVPAINVFRSFNINTILLLMITNIIIILYNNAAIGVIHITNITSAGITITISIT